MFAYARGLRDYVAPLDILLEKETLTEKTRRIARDFVCCTFRGMLWPHEQVQNEDEERTWLSRGQIDVADWFVRGGKMKCLVSEGKDVTCVLRAVKTLLFEQSEHILFEENEQTSPFVVRRKGEENEEEKRKDPKRAPSQQRILDTTISTCRELIRTSKTQDEWTGEYYAFVLELAATTQRLRVETSDVRDATLKLASRIEGEDMFIRVVRRILSCLVQTLPHTHSNTTDTKTIRRSRRGNTRTDSSKITNVSGSCASSEATSYIS